MTFLAVLFISAGAAIIRGAPAVLAQPVTPSSAAGPVTGYGWGNELRLIREAHARARTHLETAQRALQTRAKKEQPSLGARLHMTPAFKAGYGMLPRINPDQPIKPVVRKRRQYSLKALAARSGRRLKAASLLSDRAAVAPPLPLVPLVTAFEKLRRQLRSVASGIAYHAKWQRAVIDSASYFAARNALVARMDAAHSLHKSGASGDQVDPLLRGIRNDMGLFRPTAGLRAESPAGASWLFPITITTDIDDDAFHRAFRKGVTDAFVRSAAVRDRGFAIALNLRIISPAELYPNGVPATGTMIRMKDHLARFPKGALVVTTGGRSTHAWVGRAIVLGPEPLTYRILAHEFGHLLGFTDAYLRGYEGDPSDPFGVTLVEWHGLVDDLMGASRTGRVTDQMVETLIKAYSPPGPNGH